MFNSSSSVLFNSGFPMQADAPKCVPLRVEFSFLDPVMRDKVTYYPVDV